MSNFSKFLNCDIGHKSITCFYSFTNDMYFLLKINAKHIKMKYNKSVKRNIYETRSILHFKEIERCLFPGASLLPYLDCGITELVD